MPLFRYKILNDNGKVEKGVAELPFPDVTPAIRYLERQGGVVLNIRRLDPISSAITKIATYGAARIKRTDMAEFFNNLAIQLKAGVPVLDAINEILEDTTTPMLKMVLRFIKIDIESGQTFAESLARHPKVFPPLILNLARIGEETGNLDEMLMRASTHLRHIQEIISSTRRSLMYPSFLLFMVFGSAVFWFYYVVPKLVELFKDMGVELPFLTRALIYVADWVQSYLGITLMSIAVAVALIIIIRKKNLTFRYFTDLILLKTPIISDIMQTSIVARICEYLGILTAAGIGVVKTFEIIRDSMTNAVVQHKLKLAENAVRGGNSISDAFRQVKVLHPFAIRMITIGEISGRIDEQTAYVADVYRDKLNAMVEVLGKTLEPIMLVIMGLIFGAVMGGLLLPIYDLVSKMNA